MNSRKISWYRHLFQHVQTSEHLQTSREHSWPRVSCPSKANSAPEGELFCSTCNIGADAPSCTEFSKTFVFYTILTWLHGTKQWSGQFKWWTLREITLILASLESICWLCFSRKRCRHRKARALRRCTHAGASSGGAVGIPLAERKKKLAGQQGLRKNLHHKFQGTWMSSKLIPACRPQTSNRSDRNKTKKLRML